jgi:pyrroloquinoline-quinone synthase
MNRSGLNRIVTISLADRSLLDHSFYRRWEQGEVSLAELASYASQYRHFENYLPGFLGQLVDALPEGASRDLVAANLADEMGDPVPHVQLFERFAAGVGARAAEPSPAMADLLGTYDDLLDRGALHGLAGFLAYESQAAGVARSKADGLRRHYGLDDYAISFWEHHAEVDVRHADWAISALSEIGGTSQGLGTSLREAADAWWAFLDEREIALQAA